MWLKSAGENSSADENSFQKLVAPNITGNITTVRGWTNHVSVQGVFKSTYRRANVLNEISGNKDDAFDINFKASDDSAIYTGSTLQPSALLSLVAIRY